MPSPRLCFVVHYEEIALKGKNRAWFEKILEKNLTTAAGRPARVRRLPGRILLYPPSGDDAGARQKLLERLARLPGVAFAAEAVETPLDWDAITPQALALMSASPFRSFAVRASRQDKKLPFTSREAEIRLGAAVQKATGAAVDLENPEATLHVEFLSRLAILSSARVQGPGGLPVGSAGRVLCLLSGGIDSPVAAYLMMTRGCQVDFLHFHSFPFTRDRESVLKSRRIVEKLAEIQGPGAFGELAIGKSQQAIAASSPAGYRTLLFKRLMLETAARVAKTRKLQALVTGDSLGQVASQTLANLAAVSEGLPLPVLQPLVGLGKREITRIAQSIGTYAISIEEQEDCCRFLEPRQVETRADADTFAHWVSEAGIPALAEAAARELEASPSEARVFPVQW